jgi:hypothetical protein
MPIRRIALVSHNYRIAGQDARWDFSNHLAAINRKCDDEGCDTILYALYTWDVGSGFVRDHDAVFDSLRSVERVVLEAGRLAKTPGSGGDELVVEAWTRGEPGPRSMQQRFGRFGELDPVLGGAFVGALSERRIDDAVVIICGEVSIVKLRRGGGFYDPYCAVSRLRTLAPIILNPIHDYMTRFEMREKRRYFSREGHTVISVWNQGKRHVDGRPIGEAAVPWTVFHDGRELTKCVAEPHHPVNDRPDIRIGLFDVKPSC